ncbi:hypothetical protein ACS0TY_002466 [Phlomoides rotata]
MVSHDFISQIIIRSKKKKSPFSSNAVKPAVRIWMLKLNSVIFSVTCSSTTSPPKSQLLFPIVNFLLHFHPAPDFECISQVDLKLVGF